MLKIVGVLAIDLNGVMGNKGRLPWDNKEDLEHFRRVVGDYPLIMGYHTYLGLPKRYFQNREVIIFTQHLIEDLVITVSSLEQFLSLKLEGIYFLIGGAQIANLFLEHHLVDEWILTEFKKSYEGDAFFHKERLSQCSRELIKDTNEFTIYRVLCK